MNHFVISIAQKIITDKYKLTENEAERLTGQINIYDLLYWSNRIRERYKGYGIERCAIINAKSGKCREDCKYCAQSAHYNTNVKEYPLLKSEDIIDAARKAKAAGANNFGIVTSGRQICSEEEVKELEKAIRIIKTELKMNACGSLGILNTETAKRLQDAGMNRYNHNLETAESFFTEICTTHTYQDRIDTVKKFQSLGYKMCCGGIFGMGESWSQRIELAFAIREQNVDGCNMNFLHPIPGTPLENQPPLPPMEILRIIAFYRFVLFDKTIRICGGREYNLRDIQSWSFYAGANAVMVGNFLTTDGRPAQEDSQLIKDLELKEI